MTDTDDSSASQTSCTELRALNNQSATSTIRHVAPVPTVDRVPVEPPVPTQEQDRTATQQRVERASNLPTPASSHKQQQQIGMRTGERINQLVHELQQDAPDALKIVPRIQFESPLAFSFVQECIMQGACDVQYPYFTPEAEQQARALLHASSRDYEETHMLRTPLFEEPECANGDACQIFNLKMPPHEGQRKPLIAYFYEYEWPPFVRSLQQYKREGGERPALPREAMQCLLCLRATATRVVMQARIQNLSYTTGKGAVDTVHAVPIYNLVDQPGQYPAEACWFPTPEVYHGIMLPLVRLDLFGFVATYVPEQQALQLKQRIPSVTADSLRSKHATKGTSNSTHATVLSRPN